MDNLGRNVVDEYAETGEQELVTAIEVSVQEERISPGCVVIIKRTYVDCGHVVQVSEIISSEFINLTEEEFQRDNPSWEIQQFAPNEIVVHETINNFCGEHYRIRDLDGRLAIFELDRDGNEINLMRVTDIWTQFLTETDLIYIGEKKDIYTRIELSKFLEDFDQ